MSHSEIVVSKPRCPYCHDDVQSHDTKWGCPSYMAWHHQSCFEEVQNCAACDRETGPSVTIVVATPTILDTMEDDRSLAALESTDRSLTALIAKSISHQSSQSEKLAILVAELRLLEKFLFERLQEFDIETLLWPSFKGIIFESKVPPPRTMTYRDKWTDTYEYMIWLERSSTQVRPADLERYLQSDHYRSLHVIKSKKSSSFLNEEQLYTIIQIRYAIVQDKNDPYNDGKNSRVVAYSEKDIHFLIQLLHSLLLDTQDLVVKK